MTPASDPAAFKAPMTPREIVSELDRWIVGQPAAKRAVAIALRNRWRRQQVAPELRDEIVPKNIILIGPTGVGKTEISRRLARLAQAPFLKVEASKFTEVGYVGRDVESIVRDLVEVGIGLVRSEAQEKVAGRAREAAEERLLDLLLPPAPAAPVTPMGLAPPAESSRGESRETLRRMLHDGRLAGRKVEIEAPVTARPTMEILTPQGMEEIGFNLKEMFSNLMPKQKQRRQVPLPEALEILEREEAARLVDMDEVVREAVARVEHSGIVFLDEIDKIAGRGTQGSGPDVSREGVQRDLLPIVEGASVQTKYGPVRTDHVLFIASGAFHVAKPADLIPEFQGRFPIRVELEALTREDFIRILTEPRNALTRQYAALLETEGVKLEFAPDAIPEIASIAAVVNERHENIGARRLHTVLEKLLEDLLFDAPDRRGASVMLDAAEVRRRLDPILADQDLARFIL